MNSFHLSFPLFSKDEQDFGPWCDTHCPGVAFDFGAMRYEDGVPHNQFTISGLTDEQSILLKLWWSNYMTPAPVAGDGQ